MAGRPRLLLTGFGPFPGAPRNPTAEVVARVAAHAGLGRDVEIVPRILPVTWAAVGAVADTLAAVAPDVVLHLGLARRARDIRVETRACNRAAVWAVDAAGRAPTSTTLELDGPTHRAVRAPTRAMTARIAALGLPARLSDDAGDYLCNALLWRSLAGSADRPTAFLHLPPTRALRRGGPVVDVPDLAAATIAAIGALIGGCAA